MLVKRVLKILNQNSKNLTPVNLLQIDQGASILLTWVINFIKWNSGFRKYPIGHYMADGASAAGGLLREIDGNISNQQDILSAKHPAESYHQFDPDADSSPIQVSKSNNKDTPTDMVPKKKKNKPEEKGPGKEKQVVKSKQMMFDIDKKLAPSEIIEQQQALRPGWVNSSQIASYIEAQDPRMQGGLRDQLNAQEGSFQNQIVKQYQRKGLPQHDIEGSSTKDNRLSKMQGTT